MVLRTLRMRLDAVDLRFQRLDPRLELLDRHGVEVLLCKGDERIVGLTWEEVFQIHAWNR